MVEEQIAPYNAGVYKCDAYPSASWIPGLCAGLILCWLRPSVTYYMWELYTVYLSCKRNTN